MARQFTKIDPPEKVRVYHYPNGETVELEEVSGLHVSESGNHYLDCRGGKAIIAPGWRAILIATDEWAL